MQTIWNYTILDDTLPEIVSIDDFHVATAGKYMGDERIPSVIAAAQMAARSFCGWHIGPDMLCEAVIRASRVNISFDGLDMLIQMPASYISDISCVLINARKENGEWVGDACEYDIEACGVVRVYDVYHISRKSVIYVRYRAGLPGALLDSVKSVIINQSEHALSGTGGVQTEQAGGMSVTYNAEWVKTSGAVALPESHRETLNAFRVQGVY